MPRHYHRPRRPPHAEQHDAEQPSKGGTYTPARAHAFEQQQLKAEFDALLPAKRLETISRIILILQSEANRAHGRHSHLWHIAKSVYGIDPELVCAVGQVAQPKRLRRAA